MKLRLTDRSMSRILLGSPGGGTMHTMRFARPIVAVLAACACSSSPKIDPCSPASDTLQLHVLTSPNAAALSWNATTAQSYVVDIISTFGEGEVQVDGTSVTFPPERLGRTYQLHAVAGGNVCLAASTVDVAALPDLTARITDDGVALAWRFAGQVGVLERGPDADHLVPIANAAESFLDTSVADASTYVYRVRYHVSDVLDVESATPSVATLLPAARNVTAQETSSSITLGWQPPAGATSCSVFDPGPLGASPPLVSVQGSSATLTQCAAGQTCSFDVRCSDGQRSSHPAHVSASKAPRAPFLCAATSAADGPRLTWSAQPNSGSFRVERTAPGQPPAALGSVTGTSFVDATAPLFASVSYRIFAIAPDGAADPSSFCTTGPAFATNAADVANLGAATDFVLGTRAPGQTFTVQHGGQLMGIEVLGAPDCFDVFDSVDPQAVPVLAAGTDCVPVTVADTGLTLDPTLVAGAYYDLSSRNLLVSAGETLRFEATSKGDFALTADAVAGTATLFGGSVLPGRDMIFKVFVLPSAVAATPRLAATVFGGQAAVLTWTADPTAQGYDVVDSTGAVVLHTPDTHAVVALPAGGETYLVRSVSTAAFASAPVSVQPSTTVSAAENLCADATGARDDNLSVDSVQTFVADASGLLTRLDLALEPLTDVTVSVEDATSGATLASTTMHPRTTWTQYAFAALSDTTPAFDFADFSASGAHLAQSQPLRIRVHSAGFAYTFRDGPDTYPGGALTADPARDMCFKVYVDTAR